MTLAGPGLSPAGVAPATPGPPTARGRWLARHPAWPVVALLAGYPLWWALGVADFAWIGFAVPMASAAGVAAAPVPAGPAAPGDGSVGGVPAVHGGRDRDAHADRAGDAGQSAVAPDRVLGRADQQLPGADRAAAVRREPDRGGASAAAAGRAGRLAGGVRDRCGGGRDGAAGVRFHLAGRAAAAPRHQVEHVHPGVDAPGAGPDPGRVRHARRAEQAQGPVRLHEHLGRVPVPVAPVAAGCAPRTRPPGTAGQRGRAGGRPGRAGLFAEPGRVARRPGRRGLPGCPAGGSWPARAARRPGRRAGRADCPCPGQPAARGDLAAAGQREEQHDPDDAVHPGGSGCAGLPGARLRRHPPAAGQRQLDQHRPHAGLPAVRSAAGRQHRPAVAAADHHRDRRRSAVHRLLRPAGLGVPPRPDAVRAGRRHGAAAEFLLPAGLRRPPGPAGDHDPLGGAAVAQRPASPFPAVRTGPSGPGQE